MNTITRAVMVVGIAGLLLGCATAAQQQFQAIGSNNTAVAQEWKACVAAIYNSSELEPLRRDLPPSPDKASLEQLANENFASDVQRQLIAANYPRLRACRQNGIDTLAQATPTVVPIYTKLFVTDDSNLVLLVQRKLRWGEFLQRLRSASQVAASELATENQRVVAGLQAANEAELAQRRAALQAFATSLQAIGGAMQAYGRAGSNININWPVNCTTMDIRPGFSTTNCY